ncbi:MULTISPECIES: flagellar hook-length control protein FliK [unclassified Halanaerobium]|uniref:flagellar hook-length control protein FliK n=1 Tax=unclassified Halanaerobium TaxID=2641197 RepID=UPI000DF46469|nr:MULTISPECIES: flagellar hook-length control protein FliK [unclassified Halanaerobium]RCW47689.1 flagellar hook-length control protein FliK [Halanaerobium sp. MA284_MarDTE_T2]RCW84667.1 flagellar hook-length control protein FliK [Halanaerobium sp. DL-01]
MTEHVLINMIQQKPGSFSEVKKKKTYQNADKSFADIIKGINKAKSDRSGKSPPDNEKNKKLNNQKLINNQEFLDKLEKILSKNSDKTASELFSLLQGGSLNRQQEIVLQNLLSKIENSSTNLSEIKSLLQENSAVCMQETSVFNKKYSSDDKVLDIKGLKQIESLLEENKITLTEKQQSVLKNELDSFAEVVLNNSDKNYAEILDAETLKSKIHKLISLSDKGKIDSTNLEDLLKREDSKLPLLQKLNSMSIQDIPPTDSLAESNSVSAELADQLKQLFDDQNEKNSKNIKLDNFTADQKGAFPLDSNSSLGKISAAGNTESGSDKNFLDLNNNLFFSFDLESRGTAPEVDNFPLPENNIDLNQTENTDLKTQIVEKFTGEYSADTKEMQIHLEPRSLGKVNISLGYDNEKLVGKMIVENELVRTQLENSLKQLKIDLVKQGINIEQFKVEIAKNSPQQVERQNEFAFSDQETAFGDGETGQNQEYEQRKFFQGQYYVHRRNDRSNTAGDSVVLKHLKMINRAAFSSDKLNLLA